MLNHFELISARTKNFYLIRAASRFKPELMDSFRSFRNETKESFFLGDVEKEEIFERRASSRFRSI